MTHRIEQEKHCAVCGNTTKQIDILSTNAFGSPDLDTRPPEMQRSTIDTWIQICRWCGYCASDISKNTPNASDVIQSDPYKLQLNNDDLPPLTNAFLCFALLNERIGDYAQAGWAAVHAAWTCDDAGFSSEAQTCRARAAAFLQKATESHQRFAEEACVEKGVLADLLRRSGQFELALNMAEEGLQRNPGGVISDVLQFQRILATKRDVACHTIEEAIGEMSMPIELQFNNILTSVPYHFRHVVARCQVCGLNWTFPAFPEKCPYCDAEGTKRKDNHIGDTQPGVQFTLSDRILDRVRAAFPNDEKMENRIAQLRKEIWNILGPLRISKQI